MKLPKTVRISGMTYRVVRESPIIRDKELCDGETDFNGYIKIDTKLGDNRAWITLLHEILHGLDILDRVEEDDIEILACGLFQVLSDNGFLKD